MASTNPSVATPSPFKINVPDSELDFLKKKLELSRLPDEPSGYTVEQGVPVKDAQELLDYWRNTYLPNWRQHEAKLNELPMFTTTVPTQQFGELDIHFVHQRSSASGAIPLLFVHGWPGGYFEVTKLLPLLTQGSADSPAFHVVAPSLPNFGFSDEIKKRGFNLRHYGEVCHNLMHSLGYTEYVAQGGDWGSIITRMMGRTYHDQGLKAVHNNFTFFEPTNLLWQPWLILRALVVPWTKLEWQGIRNAISYVGTGNKYYQMQETRPQTVAYCLSDSPVALLGWIYEKLLHWTDDYPWTKDEILTWLSIYWFSKAGPGASVRIYFEAGNPDPSLGLKSDKAFFEWTKVPLGLTQFPRDIAGVPKAAARTLGSIAFENWSEDGGHFAAWERPEFLSGDLKKMFGRAGPAFGVVDGCDGYDISK